MSIVRRRTWLALSVTLPFLGCASVDPEPASYADDVASDAPIAWWRFEDAPASATAADASGVGHTGTYVESPVRGVQVAPRLGVGIRLTQATSGDGVNVPHAPWMSLAVVTVEAWVRPDRVTYPESILVLDKGSAWQLHITADGRPAFTYPGGTRGARAAEPLGVGQLYHLAATHGSGTTTLYVNGAPAGQAPTGPSLPSTTSDMHIGRGLSDEILSAARIRAHDEAGR